MQDMTGYHHHIIWFTNIFTFILFTMEMLAVLNQSGKKVARIVMIRRQKTHIRQKPVKDALH